MKRSRTTGVHFDVHCECVTEDGAPYTVFRCIYCGTRHAFTRGQITEIRKANEPAPKDPSQRAMLKREILKRLRGCRKADRV